MKKILARTIIFILVSTLFISNFVFAEEGTKVNITLDRTEISIPNLTTYQLNTIEEVNWKSSNTNVATVSSTGKVTAKKVGTVDITATSIKDGSSFAVCTVKVIRRTIKLNKNKHTIKLKKSYKLKATTNPKNQKVVWKSSKPKIVKVNKKTGKIIALKLGKAKITATEKKGKVKATCIITVKKKVPKVKKPLSSSLKPFSKPYDKEGIIRELSKYGKSIGYEYKATCTRYVLNDDGAIKQDANGNNVLQEVEPKRPTDTDNSDHSWGAPEVTINYGYDKNWKEFVAPKDPKLLKRIICENIETEKKRSDCFHIWIQPLEEYKKMKYGVYVNWDLSKKDMNGHYAIWILGCNSAHK